MPRLRGEFKGYVRPERAAPAHRHCDNSAAKGEPYP